MRKSKPWKQAFAAILAAVLVLQSAPAIPVNAASKKAVVQTQTQLNAALKNDKITSIEIRTNSAKTFTVKSGDYNKTLTVNASKAKVTNKGEFNSVTIKNASTFTEKADGNKIKVTDKSLTLSVSKGADNSKITVNSTGGKVTVKADGKVSSVTVNSTTSVSVTGSTTKSVKVTSNAYNAKLTVSAKANVQLNNKSTVSVTSKGTVGTINAEGSATISVANGGKVTNVNTNGENSKVSVKADGTVSNLNVNEKASVTVSGKTDNSIQVTSSAADSKLTISAKSDVVLEQSAKVTIAEGAQVGTVVAADNATITVAEGATVDTVQVQGTDSKVSVEANGTVGTVSVDAKADVAVSGTTSTPVKVEANTEGASIATSTTTEVTVNADVTVNVEKGGEGTNVTAGKEDVTVSVDNQTDSNITVTDSKGTETTVDAGTQQDVNTSDSGSGSSSGGSTGGNSGSNSGGNTGGSSSGGWVSGGGSSSSSKSSAKEVLSFVEPKSGVSGTINKEKHTISLEISETKIADITKLAPVVTVSNKASVSPASNAEVDFSKPVTYTVTAEDGSKQEYVVTVKVLSSKKEITGFTVNDKAAAIDAENHTISVTFSETEIEDVTKLTPSVTISGKSVSPANGALVDFTKPVTYTVTAEDGSKQDYVVTVKLLSSKNAITGFVVDGTAGVIDEEKKEITVTLPEKTDLTQLKPVITVSGNAAVSPASIVAVDFTEPVTYTVTAEDGSTKEYTVAVNGPLGTVEKITDTATIVNNGSRKVTVEVKDMTLQWYPADPSIGRMSDGWWVGIKVYAPSYLNKAEDCQDIKYANWSGGQWVEKSFWNNQDSDKNSADTTRYITLWGFVNETYIKTWIENGYGALKYYWQFDWNNDGSYEQRVTLSFDPSTLTLINEDGSLYKYGAYGTVEEITESATIVSNETSRVVVECKDVKLQWAPADTSIGRMSDGWWVGIKVNAPASLTKEEDCQDIKYANWSGGQWVEKSFWENQDSDKTNPDTNRYITMWGLVNKEYIKQFMEADGGPYKLNYYWAFDWDKDGTREQWVTLSFDPGSVTLVEQDGSEYKYGVTE